MEAQEQVQEATPQEAASQSTESAPKPATLAEIYAKKEAERIDPEEAIKGYQRAIALEKELLEAKEKLKASERHIDPEDIKKRAKESPKDVAKELGLDFDTVLDSYLQEAGQTAAAPEDAEPDDSPSALKKELDAIKQRIQQDEYQRVRSSELKSVSSALEGADAPILKHLSKNGHNIAETILEAAVQKVRSGEKDVTYASLISSLEQEHKKYLELLSSAGVRSPQEPEQKSKAPSGGTTLTNRLSADPPNERRGPMTDQERFEQSLEILRKGSADSGS